jgi:hypothetical protein
MCGVSNNSNNLITFDQRERKKLSSSSSLWYMHDNDWYHFAVSDEYIYLYGKIGHYSIEK